MSRPFRFGVAYSGDTIASRADLRQFAQRVEALGYSSVQIPDHYVNHVMPIAAMMAIADAAPRCSLKRWRRWISIPMGVWS